jgi:hypothetical protein
MEFDAKERLDEIAEEMGGESILREQMRLAGYRNWSSATLYPVVAWFPQYMDEPDVVGIAVRNGFSFNLVYGCRKTPNDGLNEWYAYVSLHDNYESLTEALLDHHKALIATEVDMADAFESTWLEIGEEVIAGLRPTKYNVDDDDFLMMEEYVYDVPLSDTHSLDMFKSLIETLKKLGVGGEYTNTLSESHIGEGDIMISQHSEFSDSFKDEWA